MIDSELLGKIKGKMDTDEEIGDIKKEQRKKGMGCLRFLAIGTLMFLLLIIVPGLMVPEEQIDPPTEAKLESEYKDFFKKPCLKSSVYGVGFVRTERWRNQVKQTITGQAKRYDRLSRRKEIYEKHLKDCKRLITSGVVRNMADSQRELKQAQGSNYLTRRSGSRTGAGSLVEEGAYIDYRIDSDKIIRLSVNQIRYKGYRCSSVSSIKLYKYPERIEVKCNGGKYRYNIEKIRQDK